MTTTTQPETVEIDQSALTPAKLINGIFPLYVVPDGVKSEDFIDFVKKNTPDQVFYLVGEIKTPVYKENAHTKKDELAGHTNNPRVFKVVRNIVGQAINLVEGGNGIGLADVKPSAYFMLPPMPYTLVQKVDDFFRTVYKKHGTEAIVVFTFDDSYLETDNPGDGWGICVPKQTNTAGSCNYDQESIVDDKPDEAFIVGTAHSHPGMKAYCSGTDKNDQASFDGIHITFGWTTGPTEHHIELQIGGVPWSLEPNVIFSGMPEREIDPEIEKWVEDRVVKAAPPGTTGSHYTPSTVGSTPQYSQVTYDGLPDGCPSPKDATIVIRSHLEGPEFHKSSCPICYRTVPIAGSYQTYRCTGCQAFIIPSTMKFPDLLEYCVEKNMSAAVVDFRYTKSLPMKSIWMWEERLVEGKLTDYIYPIYLTHTDKAARKKAGLSDEVYDVGVETIEGLRPFTQSTTASKGDDSGKADGGLSTATLICGFCDGVNDQDFVKYRGNTRRCVYCEGILAVNGVVTGDAFPLDQTKQAPSEEQRRKSLPLVKFRPDHDWPENTRICCESLKPNHCPCDKKDDEYFFDQVDGWVASSNTKVYAETPDSRCNSCVLAYTPACDPYITFLREWAGYGGAVVEYPEQITECNLYRSE